MAEAQAEAQAEGLYTPAALWSYMVAVQESRQAQTVVASVVGRHIGAALRSRTAAAVEELRRAQTVAARAEAPCTPVALRNCAAAERELLQPHTAAALVVEHHIAGASQIRTAAAGKE